MLADFRRYYQLDLRGVLDGTLPVTECLELVYQLPEGSATRSAIRGDESDQWDVQAHLTASLIDAVRENTWVLAAANAKRKPKKPDPVPRPTVKKKVSAFAAMARAAYGKK